MKRRLFVLTASFLMALFMMSRSNVLTALADCGDTGVDMSGATCDQSGSNPGTPGDSGSDVDDGSPGSSGTDSNNNNNNNSNNNNGGNGGGTCTPGTAVDWNFA